jgi:hypothetical protein
MTDPTDTASRARLARFGFASGNDDFKNALARRRKPR